MLFGAYVTDKCTIQTKTLWGRLAGTNTPVDGFQPHVEHSEVNTTGNELN